MAQWAPGGPIGGGGINVTPGTSASSIRAKLGLPRPSADRRASRAGMPGFGEKDVSPEFGLTFGKVHGFRMWCLAQPDFSLDPAHDNWPTAPLRGSKGHYWDSAFMEGVCDNNSKHVPPVEFDPADGQECGCGIWAYWDTRQNNGWSPTSGARTVPVAGIVSGEGRVIVGEKGFRSQNARIIALAPAFNVTVDSRTLSLTRYRGADIFGNSSRLTDEEQAQLETEVELAQAKANAWMGIIQDRLMTLYPEANVFATVTGMLASVPVGEIEA